MENLPLGRAEDDSTGLVHCNKKNRKGKLPVRKNASVKRKGAVEMIQSIHSQGEPVEEEIEDAATVTKGRGSTTKPSSEFTEIKDVMGSIRKGQVAILEKITKLTELVAGHIQSSTQNQVPEQSSQNNESMEPTNLPFNQASTTDQFNQGSTSQPFSQASTSQQSLIDLELDERETRELLESLSSHDNLSVSALSDFSENAHPNFDWAP